MAKLFINDGILSMDSNNSILVNRFFTRNTLKELIEYGECETYTATIKRYISDSSELSNSECISRIYCFLKSQYQNEYYYKNTLLNKLLLGVHNPHTTTALTEVPVGKSKADFILINGKAVVYEIKTALDNFDRLSGQLDDYYKAFSYVAVVTAEENVEEIFNRLENSPVGIYILTRRGTLSERKKPEEYIEKLSCFDMFKILRKNEYESLLQSRFGTLPSESQFLYYRACLNWFDTIPVLDAYKLFLDALKKRSVIDTNEFEKVPYELRFLVYFSHYKKEDYRKLNHFLYT